MTPGFPPSAPTAFVATMPLAKSPFGRFGAAAFGVAAPSVRAKARGGRHLSALALALTVTIGSARPARAFCRTMTCNPQNANENCPTQPDGCPGGGVPIGWPGTCMSYSVAVGPTAISYDVLHHAAEEAFAVWRDSKCADGEQPSIRPADFYGAVRCKAHEYNPAQPNANSIVYREDPWPYLESVETALALTSVTYDKTTGTILDADIEINGSGSFTITAGDTTPTAGYDLQSILTHEVGHFLGLGHSRIDTATMWATYPPNSLAYRKLTKDDVEGICAVYPPGRDEVCDYEPHLGFSPECRMDVILGGCSTTMRKGPRGGQGALGIGLFAGLLWCCRRKPRASSARGSRRSD